MAKLSPIAQAIKAAGGVTAFANAVGERKQTINQWRTRGEPPANKAVMVEKVSGISRRQLRSDWADYWPAELIKG
jgi:DNA-binding transcriptional regulator YdaS (Cro superfamily)